MSTMKWVNNDNYINPFVPNTPFPYDLKISENLKVFCFQGGRERVYWQQMG